MALANLTGNFLVPIGTYSDIQTTIPGIGFIGIDAVNKAIIYIGRVTTSDGGSHTIDTTGSSSLGWRTTGGTFANAGTTVKVGLAAVDSATGPPGRAINSSNVITFDVSKSLTGGSGITASAWQTHVPDAGSKTIADGDLIAFAVQMTARGGTDGINVTYISSAGLIHCPLVTSYNGIATYTAEQGLPNLIITFSDGAIAFFAGGEVFNTYTNRTFNSAGATKEYGQLYQLPFPVKIYGAFGWIAPAGDFDIVLYSDPLGTPVAERTAPIDISTISATTGRKIYTRFSSPYSTTANQVIAMAYKPGATNVTAYFKTMASATHRVADPWGTTGYGVSRATGAFSNANSSLDHYLLGLLVGAFDSGAGGGGGGGGFSAFVG